jgi:hypothetical protein
MMRDTLFDLRDAPRPIAVIGVPLCRDAEARR